MEEVRQRDLLFYYSSSLIFFSVFFYFRILGQAPLFALVSLWWHAAIGNQFSGLNPTPKITNSPGGAAEQ
jgi:hypothetical protein